MVAGMAVIARTQRSPARAGGRRARRL